MASRHAEIQCSLALIWVSLGVSLLWNPSKCGFLLLYTTLTEAKPFERVYGLVGKEDTALTNLESNIVSVIQGGSFLGALFSTYVSNAVGRRLSFIISALVPFVGVAMQAGANGTIVVLYAGR
jgi:MFS family permease